MTAAGEDDREACAGEAGALEKYDGDARVGFITAGMLGKWGEWHNYPRDDLWASKEVQSEVTQPIGGEIRPELWKTSFTTKRHERDQGFVACVERMHATWMMDTGLFDAGIPMDAERRATALKEVARMGYELHVAKAEREGGELSLTVENRGVAPFYYDWPVELQGAAPVSTDWKLSEVLPGKLVTWKARIPESPLYSIRVRNPMDGGKPLRFANKEQGEQWLMIGME